jgi:hypothetical protein
VSSAGAEAGGYAGGAAGAGAAGAAGGALGAAGGGADVEVDPKFGIAGFTIWYSCQAPQIIKAAPTTESRSVMMTPPPM